MIHVTLIAQLSYLGAQNALKELTFWTFLHPINTLIVLGSPRGIDCLSHCRYYINPSSLRLQIKDACVALITRMRSSNVISTENHVHDNQLHCLERSQIQSYQQQRRGKRSLCPIGNFLRLLVSTLWTCTMAPANCPSLRARLPRFYSSNQMGAHHAPYKLCSRGDSHQWTRDPIRL